MQYKYILLNAVNPADFSLETIEQLVEAAEEWGCKLIVSKDLLGNDTFYFVAETIKALEQMCTNTEMPGVVVEANAIYDQYVEV